MTETTATLEEMEKKIKTMETRLASMKKAYKNRKLEGLRIAMEARKSAEDAVTEELKALGYKRVPYKNLTSYVDQMNSVWRW
jgi:predicted  nucleic acid-binding Zn-ribbon protein